METIEIYIKGDAHTPQRFWDYALRTNYKQDSGARFYFDNGFIFSQTHTDLYKSLADNDKKKVKFLYVNGIKQI